MANIIKYYTSAIKKDLSSGKQVYYFQVGSRQKGPGSYLDRQVFAESRARYLRADHPLCQVEL